MSTHPEAFVLIHIPEVTLTTNDASESGTLALECVTLTPDDADKNAPLAASLSASDRSLILVLRLGSLELPLDPERAISLHIAQDGTRTYTFHSDSVTGGTPMDQEPVFCRLAVPPPSRPDPHRAETVEALDHILGQYADFDWHEEGAPHGDAPQPGETAGQPAEAEDLRGKLVLMDEQTGEVVGELPNRVNIKEDPALLQYGKGKDGEPAPVMLELPPDVYDAYTGAGTSVVPYVEETSELDEAREIFVRAIPPEDQDWVTKSATLISHAISTSTSLLLSGMTHATNYYMNHSSPSPHASKPSSSKEGDKSANSPPPPRALLLMSHPRTHQTLSRAYAISGQAVKVSQHTVSVVENLISRAIGGFTETKATATPVQPPQARPVPPAPSATPSASTVQSAQSVQMGSPPPPYPGLTPSGGATPDGKPPLPPRREGTPAAAAASTAMPAKEPPPPLPPRSKSPLPGAQALPPAQIPLPPSSAPSTASTPRPTDMSAKLILSANLILATVDDSLKRTFDVGSERVTAVVGHKYGPDAAKSAHLSTHTARNVALVYIDMQGLTRRALIKKAGKQWVKARFSGGGKEMSGLVVDKQEPGQKK